MTSRFPVLLSILALAFAAAAGAACGSSPSGGGAPDSARIPTATLPAVLPESTLLGSAAVQAANSSSYTVRSGDTLATVAARYGFTVEEVLALNPGIDPRSLSVGQTIRLPEFSGEIPSTPTEGAEPEPT